MSEELPSEISFDKLEPTGLPSEVNFKDLSPVAPPKQKKAPVQEELKPFTYALGGVGKTATMLPALAGAIGSAGEAGYNLVTGDDEITLDNIKDYFMKASETGVDANLIKTGVDWTRGMTDALGINMIPSRTGNQISDLVGSFAVPVPGGMLPSLVGKGIVNKLGRAATFLSPAVRVTGANKPSAIRLGASLGIGTGLEQGIRALIDDPEHLPLMFSEKALTGSISGPNEVAFEDLIPAELDASQLVDGLNPDFVADPYYDPEKAAADQAQEEAQLSTNLRDWGIILGMLTGTVIALKYRKSILRARDPAQPFGTEPTIPATGFRDAVDIVKKTPSGGFLGIGNKVKKAKELATNRLKITYANQFNAEYQMIQQARANGVPEHIIDQHRGMGGVDSVGQLTHYLQHGIAPNGDKITVSLREMKQTFDTWEKVRQEQFLEYVAAIGEDVVRTKATAKEFVDALSGEAYEGLSKSEKRVVARINAALRGSEDVLDQEGNVVGERLLTFGTLEARMRDHAATVSAVRNSDKRVEVGLWKDLDGSPKATVDAELKESLRLGNMDDEFVTMRKNLSEYNKLIIEDAARRGVQGDAWVKATLRKFQRGDEILYIPRQQAVKIPGFWHRQAINMGIATTEGKNLRKVGNLQKQSYDEFAGVNSPMSPWHTTANYAGGMIEHTNRSVTQMNWMKQLLGMEHDAKTGWLHFGDDGFPIFKDVDEALKVFRDKMFFTKTPTYVGKISPTDPENLFNTLNLRFHTKDGEQVLGKALGNKKVSDLKKMLLSEDPGTSQDGMSQLAMLKDSLVIQHQGEFHIFSGMNKNFKMAMEFDSALPNDIAKFNAYFKRIMTMNTTGRYSTFSPISFIYNASIGSVNAALISKGGFMAAGRDAIRVWRDGVKGAVDVMVTGIADDFVQMIGHTLETNIGIGSSNPAMLKALQTKLRARVKRSMIHGFREKTGGIGAGSQNAKQFSGEISDAMSASTNYINKVYGGNVLPEFVRIWDHINAGFHEGTAYGVALRKLSGTTLDKTGNQIRVAKRQAADLVGNNQLMGASMMARQLNAAIPFYGAALQGMSTLGRAVHKAGTMKTVTRLTAVIGMPTFMEIAYNSWLDGDKKYTDAQGKQWTQNQFYHHGWTPRQRANNVIVQKPGQKPWEAFVIPVIPELAAIRGFYLDAYELIFGLAEIPGISFDAGITKDQAFSADHISASAARQANLPLPPHVKAALSAFGVDARAGLSTEGADGLTVVQQRQLPKANRQTPNLEQARYEGGEFSVRFQAIVQDLGGALATVSLKTVEALFSGDESTPVSERLTAGIDALGIGLVGTSKLPGGLLGTPTLQGAGDPEVSSQVFNKIEALNHWVQVQKIQESAGTMSGNIPRQGRTSNVTLDPVTQALAASAGPYLQKVAPIKSKISDLNNRINSLHHSLYNSYDMPGSTVPRGKISIAQRNELISSMRINIGIHNKTIRSILQHSEEAFALRMGKVLGRPLSGFTFDGWKDRANPDSASPEPQTSPQTSQ